MVSWNNFVCGEAQLECKTLEEAELLLKVCKENDIDCDHILNTSKMNLIGMSEMNGL